jgi:hypothetical protein
MSSNKNLDGVTDWIEQVALTENAPGSSKVLLSHELLRRIMGKL